MRTRNSSRKKLAAVGTKRDLPYITKKIKKMMKLRKRIWNRVKKQ